MMRHLRRLGKGEEIVCGHCLRRQTFPTLDMPDGTKNEKEMKYK